MKMIVQQGNPGKVRYVLLFVFFFFACNPVKRVLYNSAMFEKVAQEVVLRGYCINDTTTENTIVKTIFKDSLIRDTLILSVENFSPKTIDTFFTSGAHLTIDSNFKISVSCPVKEIKKITTIDKFIRDRKKEHLLQIEIDDRDNLLNKQKQAYHLLHQRADEQQQLLKSIQSKLRTRTLVLAGLLLIIVLLVGFKALNSIRRILP